MNDSMLYVAWALLTAFGVVVAANLFVVIARARRRVHISLVPLVGGSCGVVAALLFRWPALACAAPLLIDPGCAFLLGRVAWSRGRPARGAAP